LQAGGVSLGTNAQSLGHFTTSLRLVQSCLSGYSAYPGNEYGSPGVRRNRRGALAVGVDRNTQTVIRTPDQRLRVFISSTLKEMAVHRSAAASAIAQLGFSPVMFETGARPHHAADLYRAYLKQSHIFLGIYGEQYGWIAPGSDISGLEEEYRLAADKPKLLYIVRSAPHRDSRLRDMLRVIRDTEGIAYKYFDSPDELGELVKNDLALLLTESFESTFSDAQVPEFSRSQAPVPAAPTPLLGREHELTAVVDSLLKESVRLVTLTGPGGSGKTRLAIEAAGQLSDRFDRVYFVELASTTEANLAAAHIAQSVGLRDAGSSTPEMLLVDHLSVARTLLVLDNLEQVRSAGLFVARLLAACTPLTVLSTSRTPLGIRGENEVEILPLTVPNKSKKMDPEELCLYPSVQLFYERARAVNSQYAITVDTADAIGEICRRLDGLPLALELAAARTRLFPPEVMLRRLEKRLPVLTGGAHDLPERQKTMASAISWSHELLGDNSAILFRRLAVFSGGCTLEAIESVTSDDQLPTADVFPALEELVAHKLVQVREGSADIRFEMLETIREYAAEKLDESGERASIESRHADYFAHLAETAEPFYRGKARRLWLERVEQELDNFRAIFGRSAAGTLSREPAVRVAGTVGWFCHLRGHLSEGRHWAESILSLLPPDEKSEQRARVLFPAGGLAWSQSDYEVAIARLSEARDIFRETGNVFWQVQAQVLLAGAMGSQGTYLQARQLAEEAVTLSRENEQPWNLAYGLYWLGDLVLLDSEDADKARSVYKQSLALYRSLEDPWGEAEVKGHLGFTENSRNEGLIARSYFEESLAYMHEIQDEWAVARGELGLGDSLLLLGELAVARSHYAESLTHWQRLANPVGIRVCLASFTQLLLQEDRLVEAVTLYGAAPEPHRVVGILLARADNTRYHDKLATVRSRLGEHAWQEAYHRGHSLSLDDAVAFARDCCV